MKNTKFLTFLLIVFLTTKNLFTQPKDSDVLTLKFTQGMLMFANENYRGALKIFKDLYKNYENNALLNLRIGQCYLELKLPDSALVFLEKAIALDTTIKKEAYLLLGQVYHYDEQIDKALEYYYKYKSKLTPKQSEKDYVNILIEQALYAKELISNPVKVKVENLGSAINTQYTEGNPSITADGKVLIFTSRRPENTGNLYDYEADCYYDDVYIARYDEKTKSWTDVKNIGPPINTEYHDANTSISPDGNIIYLYKNIKGVTGSGDIYYSEKGPTGEWLPPKSLPKQINSSFFESSACVTADGNMMFFVSERKGGYGRGDIYMVKKIGDSWGIPENLGPTINTPYDEIGVFIHPDGKTLFFSSNGHNTIGGYDIFMSYYDGTKWSKPINLGYPINTPSDEIHFVLSADRKTAYINSNRKSSIGDYDIFKIDMSEYFKTYKEIPSHIAKAIVGDVVVIVKGKVSDAETGNPIIATLVFKDLSSDQISQTDTNENGEYFITLSADKRYEVLVRADGYKSYITKFKTPKPESFETPTTTRHFLLNKE